MNIILGGVAEEKKTSDNTAKGKNKKILQARNAVFDPNNLGFDPNSMLPNS